GLHAIGSDIGQAQLDILYNANRFGTYLALGSLVTVSPDGKDGVQLESRGVAVRGADRVTFPLGDGWVFWAREDVEGESRVQRGTPVSGAPMHGGPSLRSG